MVPNPGEYKVEGYGPNPEYDGNYLGTANFDPDIHFAKAGDPEAAAKLEANKEKINPNPVKKYPHAKPTVEVAKAEDAKVPSKQFPADAPTGADDAKKAVQTNSPSGTKTPAKKSAPAKKTAAKKTAAKK